MHVGIGRFQNIFVPNHGWLPYFSPSMPSESPKFITPPPPPCPQNSKLVNPPPLKNFCFGIKPFLIGHFRIYRNTLFCPSKSLHLSIVFNLSSVPREIENNAYAKFWRDKKEYYGKFESGLLPF